MELAKSNRADGKGFKSRTSRQKPLKSARFATRMLPKRVLPICYQTYSGRGLTAGDQPFSSLWLTPLLSRSAPNFTFHSDPQNLLNMSGQDATYLHAILLNGSDTDA